MKSYLMRIIFFIAITSFVISCSTIKIDSATRRIVYPGIPSGKTSMNYEVLFNSNNSFAIKKVTVGDVIVENYSIQNIESQIFEDVKKNNFDSGKYKLMFKSFDISEDGSNNKVIIEVIQKGKTKIISTIVVEKEPTYRK
jgi:major membrane immunogen (membrane-anchored lipoprotein)